MTSPALILLASGMSERFGETNKLLATFKGISLLEHAKRTSLQTEFSARFAVIPEGAVNLQKHLKSDFILIENEQPEQGQGHSLSLGAQVCLDMGYSSACVMLADMPFVTAAYCSDLIKESVSADIVLSRIENRQSPPAIFSGNALKALTGLSGDTGALSLDLSPYSVKYVDMPAHMALDIDTPDDLAQYEAMT